MLQPWETDRPLNESAIARRIAERFPELSGAHVAYFDEGWDSRAFLVGGKWVFRFSKHADCDGDARIEIPLLRAIQPRLPIPIPEVVFDGGDWFGYPLLPGRSLAERDWSAELAHALAPQFGRFFSVLHAIPASSLSVPAGARNLDKLQVRATAWIGALDRFGAAGVAAREALNRVPAAYDGPALLVHNDLGPEHALLEGDRITGIIDWSDARLGDPATDFAGIAIWGGEKFMREVLAHYDGTVDSGLVERSRYQAFCVAVMDAHYGVESGKPRYLHSAEQALRLLSPA